MLRFSECKVKNLKKLNLNILPGYSTKFYFKSIFLNDIRLKKTIISYYLKSLLEKQKLKILYGLKESLIKKYLSSLRFKKNLNLNNLVNLRFDTFLYNIGFCSTIIQARQWIVHGHFNINLKKIKKPGFLIEKGNIISINPLSVSIINVCKLNLYVRYNTLSVFNLSSNVLICANTLKSKLIDLNYIEHNYINFKDYLIKQYYI